MNQPDPKKHFQISMAKSLLRIAAACCLIVGHNVAAGTGLVLAEVLGIVEEIL